jgi:hypothetical protein
VTLAQWCADSEGDDNIVWVLLEAWVLSASSCRLRGQSVYEHAIESTLAGRQLAEHGIETVDGHDVVLSRMVYWSGADEDAVLDCSSTKGEKGKRQWHVIDLPTPTSEESGDWASATQNRPYNNGSISPMPSITCH